MAGKSVNAAATKTGYAYHAAHLDRVFQELKSSEQGISEEEAAKRLYVYGPNELKEKKKISAMAIFLSQFKSLIVWILIAAVVISMFLKEFIDSAVILAIIFLNAVIGFVQEYRSEKAIAALNKLAGEKAEVLRDGKRKQIDAAMLVPGDIVLLETGSSVPADARLIEAVNLETKESALTGESTPVTKVLAVVAPETPIAERRDMVFSGTTITKGRGSAIAVKTGMATEVGRIAELLQETEEELTPLQKRLEKLGKQISYATIVIAAVVFVVTVAGEQGDILDLFKVAVSLAVAAIPEGLPAIVAMSLAIGVQRMVRRNALVRKLPSVETLGSTTVICADKTGTLTVDQMTVSKLYVNGEEVDVPGTGFSTFDDSVKLLLRIGALCNDSAIDREALAKLAKLAKDKGVISNECIIGDPTEAALLVSAAKAGIDSERLAAEFKRVGEVPFDSERKRMSTAHLARHRKVLYTKGAPDVILGLCSHVYSSSRIAPLTAAMKKRILAVNEKFASDALRVLGFAYKPLKGNEGIGEGVEKRLVFVGLQAMTDPPKPEVKDAISKCASAGIKVIMVTGDHKATAEAVARNLGIAGRAVTGDELDKMSDDELFRVVDQASVFARVSPEHKLRIINALKKRNQVAAMTGDGVNDAPALKRADIGIAMGKKGTDVAREASKMVLVDDNFASIVNAVEEGRGIYENIKKFIFFLLSSNLAEVLIILLAAVAGMPLPLLAIQLLWLNLLTDGLPALALGVEPVSGDVMRKKPRSPNEGILTRPMVARLIVTALTITAGTLALFYLELTKQGWSFGQKATEQAYLSAVTVAFTALVVFELFNALASKSEDRTVFSRELFNNKHLLLAIASSMLLQLAVIYLPINKAFGTVPLSLADWGIIIAAASSLIFVDTAYKIIKCQNWKILSTKNHPYNPTRI